MIRKCQKCDNKGEKTVNTKHKHVYTNGKYYHFECYMEVLMKEGRSREEAFLEAERIYNLKLDEEKEKELENDFFKLIMDIYKQPLSQYFYVRINEIINGKYKKGMPQKISYKELFEMYSNDKMIKKLDKIAYSSKIKQDKRLMWDLAVMFNQYPKYVKAKKDSIKNSEEAKEAIDNINKYKIDPKLRYKESREDTINKNKKSVNIDDIIDDILS